MIKVAYIVVGWNNQDLLGECFDSINSQTYADKLIVYVDNNSSDDSVEFVKKNYPEVKIIEEGTNTGFAKGNNIGIKAALKEPGVGYIALINSDARLEPKWTQQIIDFSLLKPKGALFQSMTLDYYNHQIIDSTHIYISHNGQGTQAGWRYYFKSELGPSKVFGVNAAACMITRKFIEAQPFRSELFDERLFMYLEDIDLAARATVMGWDNYLVPNARAYHMGSVSSGKNPGFSLYMTFRNNTAVLLKNLPLSILIKILPKLVRADIETIKTLRRADKKAEAAKVLKGRLVGIIRLPLFFGRRMKMSRYRVINKQRLWRLMDKGY